MKRILTKVGIGLAALTLIAVVAFGKMAWRYPATGTTTVTHGTTTATYTWVGKTTDTIYSPWISLNDQNTADVGTLVIGAQIPNATGIPGTSNAGGGAGLKDTVHMNIYARSMGGGGIKIADTAYGVPPCTLSVVSASATLINSDAFRIQFITFDTAGASGSTATNDTCTQTITYAAKVITTKLSDGENLTK